MRIVDTKHSSMLATTQKYRGDFPDMENSHQFILNMCKDLRKWCHESYQLFVQGNRIEDKPSIGCRENVNKTHYNPHFNFEGKIQEYPNDSNVILNLFNASAGNEIYDPVKSDSGYFPASSIHYLDALKHLTFLSYIYKTSVICCEVPSKPKQLSTTTYSWYHVSPGTGQSQQLLYCWICTPSSWSSLHCSFQKNFNTS